jgi:phosphoadenosine phosphosulfate reductase
VGEPRLWKDGAFIADPWRVLNDNVDLPGDGHAIVSLARWRAGVSAGDLRIGVRVQPDEALDASTDHIHRLGVIALVFPKFSNGRAYSLARQLREVHGYRREIRATGDVLLDQIPLMLRCGFDALEIVHLPTIAALEKGPPPALRKVYQPAAANSRVSWQHRRVAV